MIFKFADHVEDSLDHETTYTSGFDAVQAGGGSVESVGIRVLLAEDNPANRFVALTFLQKNRYLVSCAENGREVLELLSSREFDIVLMDIQMPVMDGVEATHHIRRGGRGIDGSIPIIALTAYAMKGDRERFLDHGMDEYMSKPVNFRSLFELIDRLVRERQTLKQA